MMPLYVAMPLVHAFFDADITPAPQPLMMLRFDALRFMIVFRIDFRADIVSAGHSHFRRR
jgi:hypothetical protein